MFFQAVWVQIEMFTYWYASVWALCDVSFYNWIHMSFSCVYSEVDKNSFIKNEDNAIESREIWKMLTLSDLCDQRQSKDTEIWYLVPLYNWYDIISPTLKNTCYSIHLFKQ